jgi:hypothetical protein
MLDHWTDLDSQNIRPVRNSHAPELTDVISYLRIYQWALRLYHPEAGITLHFVKMHPNIHLSYGILDHKYKHVTITLQKEWENPLTISFCF